MRTISPFEVPQLTFETAELCGQLSDQTASRHEYPTHAPPIVGLNMAYNSIIQAFELLDFYYHHWSKIAGRSPADHQSDNLIVEQEERISHIQKSTFILTLSAFEAAAKQALALSNSPLEPTKERTYLSGIMARSHRSGLIDDEDRDLWKFAIELRNCIVHNNAIAERNFRYDLGTGLTLEMNDGHMTQSTPRKSNLLLKAVVKSYARWCDAFLSALSNAQSKPE